MPIKRSSDQKSMTLEEFYLEFTEKSNNSYTDVGKKMLEMIEMINDTFKDTLLWGLTSHARLVIQAEDNWRADWYVIISNIGTDEYYFEYLLPDEEKPWPNATVRGEAKNLEEAKRYLLIAMHKSKGWFGNEELKALIELNGVK
jgi:hypothetical protein